MSRDHYRRPTVLFRVAGVLVAGVLLPIEACPPEPRGPVVAQEAPASDAGVQSPQKEPGEDSPGKEAAPAPAPRVEAAEGGGLKGLLDRLRRDYPDREAVARGGDAVPRALIEFADKHVADAALAEDVGRARQLAAEAFLVQGRRSEELRVYALMATEGPLDSHRALALFVLGEDQFLREEYVSSGRRRAADYYWGLLIERFPGSDWARRVDRPMRYIGFLKGGQKAPEFSATFEQAAAPGEPLAKRLYAAEELRGQVVLIEFWTAGDAGRGERVKALGSALASNLKEYPDLAGKVQALGVHLDTSRELFDAAVAAWGTPWPELHDGLGFRSPLAEAFAIPRAPHWVVIEAGAGRIVYIGADYDRFLAAATLELRRVRGLEE